MLRVIFDLACEYEVIEKSPVKAKLHKPEVEEPEKPTLTVGQVRQVLAGLSDPQERLFALLIAVTGMRLGEALALRRASFNGRDLAITHTLWHGRLKPPKTEGSVRVLRLPDAVAGLLAAHLQGSTFQDPDSFIFCRPDASPLQPETLRQHLYKAMDGAGIKRKPGQYGFHIFRHTAGSLLYAKSRDLKLVQGALGHTTISTTSDVYVHLDGQIISEGADILAAEILGNCDLSVPQSSRMVN